MSKRVLIEYLLDLLRAITLLGLGIGLFMTFVYVPTDVKSGDVQRIFYFHLPLAWIGFLAFFLVFLCGIIYLVTRSIKWDIVAHSSAEIGFVFSSLVLITGSIWARVAWNTWWTWEPRLTTMLVLWLIYLGYLMTRRAVENIEKQAGISAVIGIVGFINVPIVFMSIRWWRTQHPVVITGEGIAMAPSMTATLFMCLGAFTFLFAYLLILRAKLGFTKNNLQEIRSRIEEQ